MKPIVTAFFHQPTFTVSYVVAEPEGRSCAIIDSALDFDAKSGRTATGAADEIVAFVTANGLTVDWILETHGHADHLTAAPYLKSRLGGRIGIGAKITTVQETFTKVFNTGDEVACDGSQFDHLFQDDESFALGGLGGRVLHTPGHTPACLTYLFDDAAFVGDTLFMPDFGTARCDFPGGDAALLYRSIRRILALPPETRVFVGHDYGPGGRDYAWETTVAAERAESKHVRDGIDEDQFVALRRARDAELEMPSLILPAIQVNMRAGALPAPEDNGVSYLKLPLNAL